MPYYTAGEILARLDAQPAGPMQTAHVDLTAGDSAWNPATANLVLRGPGRLVYHRYPDGGVYAELVELEGVR